MQPRLSGKDDARRETRASLHVRWRREEASCGDCSPSSRSLGLMSFSGSAPLATSPTTQTTNTPFQSQPDLYTIDPSLTTFTVQMPSPPPRAEERPASPRTRSRSRSPRRSRSRSRSPAPRKPKSYSGLKWKNDKKDSSDRDGRRRDDRDDRRRDDRRDFDRRDGRDDRRGDRYSRDDRDRRGGDRDRRDDRRGDRRDDRDRRDTRDNRDRHPDRRSDKPPRDKKPAPAIASTGEAMIIVTVNDRLGTKTQVPCLPSDPVKVLKAMVAAKIGRPVHEIMLKRQGERPFHDSLSLADYAISNGVQIDLELNTGD
ncbi:hypothetical protein B5807_11419 [Epicoccum nigrum]|uniref:Ubiquitin-like modifier HUB1 n=1 Tax=Epicoccum nigrum TaxID=105696 RepID=A0A1Y2LK67_EPING|nr:hypothetical protein B5807_11419 [Epicoccum nigrum]